MLIYYCLVNRLWACQLIDDASRSPNQIGIRRLHRNEEPDGKTEHSEQQAKFDKRHDRIGHLTLPYARPSLRPQFQ